MAKEKAKRGTLKKALRYIGKYKYLLPISILMALVSVALTLYVPMLIGEAIDFIVGRGEVDLEKVFFKLLYAAILVGVTAVAQWIMAAVNNRIAFRITEDVRNEAFERLEKLPLAYIDSHPHGDAVNRVINDTDRFSEGLLLGFTQVFTGVLTIVGTLVFMLYIRWEIALAVVVLTPISIFIAKFIGSRTYSMFKARSEAESDQTALIDEMIGNQKIVRAFGREDEALAEFDKIGERLEHSTLRAIFF